ncbi:MAG: response regulator transcription factor, partial [Armatimonadota bacterium]|nr:response regulator transcription factor [Armatimonadota bacterium]
MAKERVLVIDDDEDILRLLEHHLSTEGYSVLRANTGETGLATALSERPDVIVLDLMLPGLDGLDVCRILKRDRSTAAIPIIMLTARGDEADIVAGLELGAEDYVVKPFSLKVLTARIRAALRRTKQPDVHPDQPISSGGIFIDPQKLQVTADGKPVELTLTEFRILHALAQKPGWVFTREQLVRASRGDDADVTERSVDVHVVSLRRKLGDLGRRIETVRGVGYRLTEESTDA